MMRDAESNAIVVKSKAFALQCIRLRAYLVETKREYELSRQLLRSGTSIGANVKRAESSGLWCQDEYSLEGSQ